MFCNANNGPGASRHSQSAWPALIKYTLKMLFNNYDICQCRMSTISGHCYGCNCTPNSTALGGMWKCLLHEFTRLWTGKSEIALICRRILDTLRMKTGEELFADIKNFNSLKKLRIWTQLYRNAIQICSPIISR